MIDDVLLLCSDLIRCKSITPADDGVFDYISNYLSKAGFDTKVLTFTSPDGKNRVKNLYARYKGRSSTDTDTNGKILGFMGHADVVPAGDAWEVDPFEGVLKDGYLYGRGVCDMKGGIAAFCSAVSEFIRQKSHDFDGSIVILITGDEENGTKEGIQSLIEWCKEYGEFPNDCLIGEPSSKEETGDRIYIGHRGSINITAKSVGKQGHVAYQGSYVNSLSNLCKYITKMLKYEWKHEDKRFPKTNIEPTMLFTNNYATNVVPDKSSANLNIRYSSDYHASDLEKICKSEAHEYGISLEFDISGDAYCCDDPNLKSLLSSSIKEVTGLTPEFSCAGGTSDGRYMIKYCNIIEFGLPDANIHQKNERAKVDDILTLSKIYLNFLLKYFGLTILC